MNRRSLFASLAAALAAPLTYVLPARAVPTINWKEASWGREVIVAHRECSFLMLPLLTGNNPDSLVYSLSIMHVYYGDRKMCEARLAEQEARHIGRPAALLAVMGPDEKNYSESDIA